MRDYPPAAPDRRRKSRHDAAKPELLTADVELLYNAIRADPLRTLGTWGMERYAADQGWTPGYLKAVRAHMAKSLIGDDQEMRAWLINFSASLVERCEEYVTGTAPSSGEGEGGGTIYMRDPRSGDIATRIDHKSVQGYLKIIGELTGCLAGKGQINVSVAVDVSDQLMSRRARAGIAPRTVAVEHQVVDDVPCIGARDPLDAL